MERINKETGELSASGESLEGTELTNDECRTEVEDPRTGLDTTAALKEQLLELTKATTEHREEQILHLLPTFIQVCESTIATEDLELQSLATYVSETLVFHIQQIVAKKPAEEARYELEQFFQRREQGTCKGWLLLKAESFLSTSDAGVNAAIITGLAAALVKCLYLFVALPAKQASDPGDDKCSFQDVLVQVILQLCRQERFVEQLVEIEELRCVIIALTSLWDQCSASWRKQVSRVLRAVSAAQVPNTVPALQAKNCMKLSIQNMLKMNNEVNGLILAEVAVNVFSFVKDSYPNDPALFLEFENNDGYTVLQTILARCEEETSEEDFPPVQDLLDLIASFTLLGKTELKVALCVNNPQPPGFKFDPPLITGTAVKNLRAFQILQSSFLRSGSALTCSRILCTIHSIWSWDKANFFLLEWTLQCLAQLADSTWQKPATVHSFFFNLLETVVFQLSYIPHDTLRKVQAVLKEGSSQAFSLAALKCFHDMVMRSSLLSDVLSDGGLMDLLLVELKRRAKILRKAGISVSKGDLRMEDCEQQLTTKMLNVVAALAMRSVRNTAFIRESGMIPYIKIFLDGEMYRSPTLCILEQLSEMNPEEYMSTAIGALCSSTETELQLKQDLLHSILKVLDNPNSWNAFRTAGGFTSLLSMLVDMEGSLLQQPVGVWASLNHQSLMELLLLTLHTMAMAVHLHPVNAHFFHITNLYERLAEALLQIGCFLGVAPMDVDATKDHRTFQDFLKLAECSDCSLPAPLQDCIKVLDFLEQFGTGISRATDLCAELSETTELEKNQQVMSHKTGEDDFQGRIRKAAVSISSISLDAGRFSCDHSILHPGAIKVIMTLLPHIYCPSNPQLSVELQLAVAQHVQTLVKSERNRQIMCDVSLLDTLLNHCRDILSNSTHSLHFPVVRILEKLASQSIDHKCLRQFLCLQPTLTYSTENCNSSAVSEDDQPHQNPLSNGHCANHGDEHFAEGGKTASKKKRLPPKRSFSLLNTASGSRTPTPLHQIISLVSITSPRSFRPHRVSVSPPFVEFDMTDCGYGCLLLPSLATVKGVSADSISTGGIGGECRGFPPSAGLSFSCWFLISRFSSACDSHPVRLLTVVRHMSRAEQHFSCLSINISSLDGCLVISTEEEAYQFLDMMEPMAGTPTALPSTVSFKCSKQLMPGLWHHLVVTMAKDIKKACVVTAYLNGEMIGTSKMRYIQPFPGPCIAMDATAVIDVYGIIGTPPIWKQHAALIWRVGPAYFFEEVLSSDSVAIMYAQGTRYLGSYLALDIQSADGKSEFSPVRLAPPERISFGINPAVAIITTVSEIRDQYNEVDCRLIAKEMGIPSRDNSTPVFLVRNISQHLSGTARTIGAALVGYFGMRAFTPNPASSSFQYIGGPAVVLSLVAMATDDSSLYAAVKVLLSVLDTNPVMKQEMKRINGYKLFAFLLKMKAHVISCRTFQLILAIVGTVELGTGNVYVHDLTALQGILCNFEVWQKAPESLDLSVLKHFVDILKSSSGGPQNAEAIHSLGLMMKLLYLLQDPTVTQGKVTVICSIIKWLLHKHFNPIDIHRLGLFLIHTLLPPTVNEKMAFPFVICEDQSQPLSQTPGRTIWIRNQLLEVLSSLIISDTPLPNNEQEDVFFILGSDWFLLFLQGHIHSTTVLVVLKILVHFLSHQDVRTKFKEAVSSGTLVENINMLKGNIDNLQMHSWSYGYLSGTFPGFTVLPRLLLNHINLPQIYGAFAALLFGKSDFHVPDGQVDLDSMLQSVIDSSANEQRVQLCTEAACVLIELVKMIICKPITGSEDSWDVQYPGSVMQFLCLVHSNFPRDTLWASSDFLNSLASAVFPTEIPENAAGPQNNEDAVDTSAPRLSHPARKQVCDFIRILFMDSLINIPAKDQHHPFIQLLEFSPDNVCQEQKQSFQSELLEFLMDIIHITGQEGGQSTHLARDDSSTYSSEGKFTVLSENVAFFSKMLVEKLNNGMFVVDPENLLVFLAEQIAMALERRQPQRETTISVLYKSLNRTVLYFLSRPRQTPAEKELILRTLQVLQQHWDIIMATYNASTLFISCLLHCLLLIRSGSFPEGFGCEMQKKPSRKIWRYLFPLKSSHITAPVDLPNSAEVESKLLKLVESTWDLVMQERRASLEEAYKIDLSAKQTGKEILVSMSDVSPLWEEIAMKAWQVFIDSQKKKMNIGQRKISILISRSPQRTPGKDPDAKVETFLADTEVHRKLGEEIFETLMKNHMQALHCENELMAAQWLRIEEDLLHERGLFGPGPGVFINQGWVQDAAEGPNRTRLRIRRKAARRSKKLPSLMPGQYMKHSTVEENRGVTELSIADTELRILSEPGREAEQEPSQDCEHLTFFPTLTEVSSVNEDISEQCDESQIIIQQLAPDEEINMKHCVAVVSGHMLVEGVLLFGKSDLYVCEGFTLTSSGDVCCGNHHPTSVRDSFISGMLKKERSSVNLACRRWSYEDIKEAHFIRFLLEENAIEVFMKNGTSMFLVFVNKDHVSAFKRLCSVVPSLKGRGVTEAVVRKTTGLEKVVIAKWQKGEMSNFEYLMHLNTLAGRTYNDLMQYPVFPWILADYESETLDLSSPTSFRDLSKPMGAQNEKRREKFIQRYNEVDGNDGELSAQCHYCTHYSSAIIVASYLVRMEPFSQTFISLQGGSFDVPERMFHSIQKEWESASKDNMCDVRELIPEFFYLPDFLINSNNFEFGCMQDGTYLGDVVLPPWAKGDPQEFIRMHREALESDYVSANLHLWIDLIFGYKQQGPAAVDALNTFHPYFYTDKHDAESMKNPLKKSTVLGYVSNFGQIPKQLFTKPHPSRNLHKTSTSKEMTGANHITPFFFKLDKLKPSAQPVKELMHGPVGQIICGERDILVTEKNKLLMPPLWNTYFCWGYYDNTCSFGNYATEKDFAVWEGLSDWGETVCATCPNNNIIITAGSSTVVCVWDVSFSKDKFKYMKLKQALYGHTDTVTCVVVSESHSVIISGSQDQTCILWDLEDLNYITQLPSHSSSVTALAINDLTGEIVSCSGTNLYLWTMKGQLLASANTPYGPEGSILCCCFTQKYEWDPRNVIITGCSDGIVRIWKTEYTKVQLPGHEEHSVSQENTVSPSAENTEHTRTRWERHLVLCKELNRSRIISRRRYKNNPAVTALAISRTHGTLLVGDAWGRVFTWTYED